MASQPDCLKLFIDNLILLCLLHALTKVSCLSSRHDENKATVDVIKYEIATTSLYPDQHSWSRARNIKIWFNPLENTAGGRHGPLVPVQNILVLWQRWVSGICTNWELYFPYMTTNVSCWTGVPDNSRLWIMTRRLYLVFNLEVWISWHFLLMSYLMKFPFGENILYTYPFLPRKSVGFWYGQNWLSSLYL